MTKAVVKGAGYVVIHANDMVVTHGTTLTGERAVNPNSELFEQVANNMQSYEEMVAYPPHQCYIGNITPEELDQIPRPWYENPLQNAKRQGKFGDIMPLDEFIGVMKISDAFELVHLEKSFVASVKEKLLARGLFTEEELARLGEGQEMERITARLETGKAEELVFEDKVVGCVLQAHDSDVNLTAHIMFENTVAKASGIIAMKLLFKKNNIDPLTVDYIIETSEEACGDMNQRGGGNFAKAIGELSGTQNATGSDLRGFCAAPVHGLIHAATMVASGAYKNVVVVAGGSTAKLGMNSRDHIRRGVPVLENGIAGFAVLIGEDDGVSPYIRMDAMGRHTISSGSAPQAVTTAIVTDPLDRIGLGIKDIDKYAVEMQNPEITQPAGAGNVPEANYKMIAALGVKRGDMERSELMDFVAKHGMPGWALTQGHIPSGVPYVGFARDAIMSGAINRAMIVGKGSLFLGRMTNLFDGASFVMEANPGKEEADSGVSKDAIRALIAESMRKLGDSLAVEA